MLAYATPERRAQWLQSTPLGRFGDTADIAELAVFLASDKGGYITGAKINVNGGLSTGGAQGLYKSVSTSEYSGLMRRPHDTRFPSACTIG